MGSTKTRDGLSALCVQGLSEKTFKSWEIGSQQLLRLNCV
jgi:hypothetical protein